MEDRRLTKLFKAEANNETILTQEESTEYPEVKTLLQNCAFLKSTTNNLKSLVAGLLDRITSLENEVTDLKSTVKKLSQSPPSQKVSFHGDIISETKQQEDTLEQTFVTNKIVVQAEVHAEENGKVCHPMNHSRHQNPERKRIQRGRVNQQPSKLQFNSLDKPLRIQAASKGTHTSLDCVAKLNKNTNEEALRYHLLDIGLKQTDIADVIKLRCRNTNESSFCVSLNDQIAETVLFSTAPTYTRSSVPEE